jgi:hypothetical protein
MVSDSHRCGKDHGDYDQSRDNRVQYSRDCADARRILRAVPFKALMDRYQLDYASATKPKTHEEERNEG